MDAFKLQVSHQHRHGLEARRLRGSCRDGRHQIRPVHARSRSSTTTGAHHPRPAHGPARHAGLLPERGRSLHGQDYADQIALVPSELSVSELAPLSTEVHRMMSLDTIRSMSRQQARRSAAEGPWPSGGGVSRHHRQDLPQRASHTSATRTPKGWKGLLPFRTSAADSPLRGTLLRRVRLRRWWEPALTHKRLCEKLGLLRAIFPDSFALSIRRGRAVPVPHRCDDGPPARVEVVVISPGNSSVAACPRLRRALHRHRDPTARLHRHRAAAICIDWWLRTPKTRKPGRWL